MNLKMLLPALVFLFLNACDNQDSVSPQSATPSPTETVAVQNVTAPVAEPAVIKMPSPEPQPVAVAAVSQAVSGETVYKKSCSGCHASGAANAPKVGDKIAWKPRIAKGMNVLLQSAINGVPNTAMMKRGTCASCSDADLTAAVEYMVLQSQ